VSREGKGRSVREQSTKDWASRRLLTQSLEMTTSNGQVGRRGVCACVKECGGVLSGSNMMMQRRAASLTLSALDEAVMT
jgi:hypothetical protein